MHKTPLAVALALLVLPAAPPADALTVRSFLDVAAGFHAGDGVGLYDAGSPPAYCLALTQFNTSVSPVSVYHMGLRYWPGYGVNPFVNPNLAPLQDPTGCAFLVPGTLVQADPFHVDVGGAFLVRDMLDPTSVAVLGSTSMTMEYCTAPPGAVTGTAGLVAGPVGAFLGQAVNCAAPTTDVLYPAACASFSLATVPGELSGTSPVFLQDAQCNSLQGQPLFVDFVAQRCASISALNQVTGVTTVVDDSDFFVVAKDGALLSWVTALGTLTGSMFPNVSNLEPNVGC